MENLKPRKKLDESIIAKFKDNNQISQKDIEQCFENYLYLFGSCTPTRICKISVAFYIDRLRLYYQGNSQMAALVQEYQTSLKTNPSKGWQDLNNENYKNLSQLERYDLHTAYIKAFGDSERMNNSNDSNRTKIARLQKLKAKNPLLIQFKNELV
jgi:hypothetical protein